MKYAILVFSLALSILVSTMAQAESISGVYSGRVQKFASKAIATDREVSYFALQSGGDRILLPNYIDGQALYEKNATLVVIGSVAPMMCTDMSEACPSGYFDQIQSFKVKFDN